MTDDASSPDWLSVTPDSGSSTGETDVATVSVNSLYMVPGTYNATITISAPGATNTPQTVPVTLAIDAPPPTICYGPTAWGVAVPEDGPNPPCNTLSIHNCGGVYSTLTWSASSNAAWLHLSPESGSSTGETDQVSMCIDKTGMSAGIYPATVTISAPGATNTPQYVQVSLSISPPTTPNAPTGLVATAVSSSQIDLSWQDNSDNEDGFRIYRSDTGAEGTFSLIATVGADVETYSDTDLGSTYYYRVRAFNAVGDSNYTEDSATTPAPEDEGEGCFIATAAYGSYLDSHVQTLRDFRDQYLVTNPVGQALVSTYYDISPPMARFIDDHPALKPVVRVGLLPAVAMSTVAVNTTSAEKAAIAGSLALVSVALAVWLSRRRGKGVIS